MAHVLLEAVRVTHDLRVLLEPCFGPDGLSVLLERRNGHAILTKTGTELLESLQLSHPVGQLICNAVKKVKGDGCKKMLLMLAITLREIQHCSTDLTDRFKVLCSFHALLNLCTSSGFGLKRVSDVCCATKSQSDCESLRLMCTKVLNTCLGQQYSYSITKKLREMVLALLFPSITPPKANDPKKVLKLHRNYFDTLTHFLPVTSVNQSLVLPGFLIERDFVNPSSEELKSFRFLVLMCGLKVMDSSSENGTASSINLKSLSHLRQTMDIFTLFIKRIVDNLHDNRIKLLVCGGKIPPAAAQLLRQHNILAVQMVPEDTLIAIASYCGTHPLSDVTGLAPQMTDNFWLEGDLCKQITVGNTRLIQLVPAAQSATPVVSSLLMCGPTVGYCRQLVAVVRRALTVLEACFQTDHTGRDEVLVVYGGGVWEITVAKHLEKLASRDKDSAFRIAAKALQNGLLAIPEALLSNSSQSSHSKATIYHQMLSQEHTGLLGVDTVNGCLKPVDDNWPTLEPYSSHPLMCHLLATVLSVLIQVLRIDSVLSVQGRVSKHIQKKTDDSNDDDDD